jgi:hypothetical protein
MGSAPPLHAAAIFGVSGDQDFREIKFIHQIKQELHLIVIYQPLTRREPQNGGLI